MTEQLTGKSLSTNVDLRGPLAWFAQNSVAANLLMIAIVATGVAVAQGIRQEVIPNFALDEVEIEIEYRGASPEEVERSIILPIEAELRGMELIRRVEAIAREGRAKVTVELVPGSDRNRGLQEVTAAVQRVSTFPDEAEPAVIELGTGYRRGVMLVAIYGDVDERTLVDFAREIETGLLAEPNISLIDYRGLRRPEIEVEIPQATMRSLGLTLGAVAKTIDESARDVPAGIIRGRGGDVLLKTTERRDFASEFGDIPILSTPDGAKIRLSDIAEIRDGFEESEREAYFDGKSAIVMSVYSSETQSPLEVARAVRRFLEQERKNLPPSMGIRMTLDRSVSYNERLSLLLINGTFGLLLVLLALGFFLELRVAFWTAAGIPVSILGSIALLPWLDASINMLSLFGFIVTLGIVVDDAVVVGEDIFYKRSQGMTRLDAAVAGVRQMSVPVVFAVSTNIIAFLPLLFIPGETGEFFRVIPAIVIAVFAVSLVECLFILPSHLAHARSERNGSRGRFQVWQTRIRLKLDGVVDRLYSPLLRFAVRRRALTIVAFTVGLGVIVSYVGSGHIDFTFRPTIETYWVQAEIEMPSGTPIARTREVAFDVERAARRALKKNGEEDIHVGVFTTVAERGSSEAEVSVILVPQSKREITSQDFANLWRQEIGTIPDIDSLFFDYLFGPGGSAEIQIELSHPEIETLRQAATDVASRLERFPGVEDIRRGFGRAMPQLNFQVKPSGRSLGITAQELGEQIRHAFYGAEALRQPRGRDEVRIMVKLPDEDRRSMSGLEELLILVPGGGEIPLGEAAEIDRTSAPVRIERVDGSRVVDVTANVTPGVNNGNRILSTFEREDVPELFRKYPGLRYTFEGEQREQRESIDRLSWGLAAAILAIYAIMAALLRSYVQALLVLLTIPWSLAGAVIGHVVMGFDLSMFSVFGMIALCGMVVNGAFVLVSTRNRYVAAGIAPAEATVRAAERRFRPILLTAITTFLGLGPMIFETSIQALFLVPMAISLGIGTLVSAVFVMFFVPAVLVGWRS
jgi:multidrug efflux pump subunit AcrB